MADEIAKALANEVKPEYKDLKEKIDTLAADVKPELKCLNMNMDILLRIKEPSPPPTTSRMPLGLADLMHRVEEQLARVTHGKNVNQKYFDDEFLQNI
ncbi:hypothetical protein OROGR_023766 [Orobanche gracilis]